MRLTVPGAAVTAAALSFTLPLTFALPAAAQVHEQRAHDQKAHDQRAHDEQAEQAGERVDPSTFDEPPPAPAWGLHSGDTIPHRDIMPYGEIGWPDVSFGFQRGMSSNADIGVRVSMLYGVHYIIPKDRPGNVNDLSIGFGVTVPIRFTVVRNGRISVLVHVDPGIRFDYLDSEPNNNPPFIAPQVPVGIDLGVHISPRTTLTLGLDLPFAFQLTPDPTIFIPILAGVTFERRFTDHFGMSLNLRPGLLYGANRTGSATDVALLAQAGFFGRL